MLLRIFWAMVAIVGLVGLMFFNTSCSIISYSNMEPENPYTEPVESRGDIAVGFMMR